MKIKDLFKNKKQVFSLEIFPPKREDPIETVYDTLDRLKPISPDFISVTYGASGSGADSRTFDIASYIKNECGIESCTHLTCVNTTREDIDKALDEISNRGVENILALRGDDIPDETRRDDFPYASDLVKYISESNYDFGISGACYPEVHKDSKSQIDDITNLKKKVDAGADHLISQLFFDNDVFYDFIEKSRIAGINVPIEAGIMPVVNAKQIVRLVSICGASLPRKFSRMIERYQDDPEAMKQAGIAYAVDQIVDLLTQGVEGIHLYTMNKPDIALKISESIGSLFIKG
jgi:methylenetetrahydrofolate reductase (NADPH)